MQFKRTFIVLLCLALFSTVYFFIEYKNFEKERNETSVAIGTEAVDKLTVEIDSLVKEFIQRAERTKREIIAFNTEEDLINNLKSIKESYNFIYGITAAFEPGFFLGKERFAPFYDNARDSVIFVEEVYDYADTSLASSKWYTEGILSDSARWSKPYFAEAANEMVIDYTLPIKVKKKNVGVLDFSIALTTVTALVQSLTLGESGYGFIADQEGTIISHPNTENLLENLYETAGNRSNEAANAYQSEASGYAKYTSTYTYNESFFFFNTSDLTGWKYILVLAESDLLGNSDFLRKKTIQIGFVLGMVLLFGLLLLLNLKKVNKPKLWVACTGYSIIMVGNIVLICYLNLNTDFSLLESDKERIVNQSIINKYVETFDEEQLSISRSTYTRVPLGLYVESFEIKTSFEGSLSGKLWLKYPKSLLKTAPIDLYVNNGSAVDIRPVILEKTYEIDKGEYVLVEYNFRVTVEEDFSYKQFPFEENDLSISFSYPDASKNILFVPDLESYDVLNPSAKPGLRAAVNTPAFKTISTFFTFETFGSRTNFGTGLPIRPQPNLVYTIVIKRLFVSPIIANIIPILVVALIMFLVLYISSRDEEKRSGMNVMNVVQSAAGFLFILIISQVNERGRIQTPELTYIELYYFCIYGVIVFQTILTASFLRGSESRFFKHDNLRMKLLFWPVLLTAWYISTITWFY